jgi:hypothetical protein
MLKAAVEIYRPQLQRYRRVVEQLIGVIPRTLMCFLNAEKAVEIVEVL